MYYENEDFFDFDFDIILEDLEEDKKCECGSEACGSPYHSDWCPKYKKEQDKK